MNTPTIIVASIVAVGFFAIIIKAIVDKKKGKSSCGCGCSCAGCSLNGTCHPTE
ncbi:MAG: FeoB-associated Cys-rich membrane protein [Clostridia bacterium]|nr:FeoB-associated Cys-rich membrane protein [Clostridia bacterium]